MVALGVGASGCSLLFAPIDNSAQSDGGATIDSSVTADDAAVDGGGFPMFTEWTFEWGLPLRGMGSDELNDMALGPSGEIIIGGLFQEDLKIGSFDLTGGISDAFVARLDRDGTSVWAKTPIASLRASAHDIAITSEGTVKVMGIFDGDVNFGNGALSTMGASDIFLADYEIGAGGSESVGSTGGTGSDFASGLAILSNDDLVSGGQLGASGPFMTGNITLQGTSDILIGRSGAVDWIRQFGTVQRERVVDVATSATDQVFALGSYETDLIMGASTLPTAALADALFLAGMSPDGGVLWAVQPADVSNLRGGIVAAGSSAVAVASTFQTRADIDSQPYLSDTRKPILRVFDQMGGARWQVVPTGTATCTDHAAIAMDPNDRLYLAIGVSAGTLDFEGIVSDGPEGLLIMVFTPAGTPMWAARIGAGGEVIARSIKVDSDGAIVVAGQYFESMNLGGVGSMTLESGFPESFVLRLTGVP
jgi:hypothetical protein